MTIEEQIENLKEISKITYDNIINKELHTSIEFVKKCCKSYNDIRVYSFHLVYRNLINFNDVNEYVKLIDIFTQKLYNLTFLKTNW